MSMTATVKSSPSASFPDPPCGGKLRWLFFKEQFAWPRASGHDVHTFFMMKALSEHGHHVSLATNAEPPAEAIAGVHFSSRYVLDDPSVPLPPPQEYPIRLSKAQSKFRNYWGISEDRIRKLAACAADCQAEVVVVSGLNVLPYLGALPDTCKSVWYAADEWVWHHWSMVRALQPSTWHELKAGLIKGLYERAYRPLLDRVWVVSQADAAAFRWLVGIRQTEILPNGVDAEHYTPNRSVAVEPKSCVFWGRLDFGPNIQAIAWFAKHVWPLVRAREPEAVWRIYGFQPTSEVMQYNGRNGIRIQANLPDIRPVVQAGAVVVLPFVSGGGIKNKLLEAAAMGRPILASTRVKHGLQGTPPLAFATSPRHWAEQLTRLWANEAEQHKLGDAARDWVAREHTWAAVAGAAADGLMKETRR